MQIKNNSKREWLDYKVLGNSYDLKSGEVIDVPDEAGAVLLRTLGHPNWLTRVDVPSVVQEPTVEAVEKVEEVKEEVKEKPKPFCDKCDSKGRFHKKDCINKK